MYGKLIPFLLRGWGGVHESLHGSPPITDPIADCWIDPELEPARQFELAIGNWGGNWLVAR